MPIALARIETERPSRYLRQFCKHAAAMGDVAHSPRMHLHPGMRRDVQVEAHHGEAAGTVTFDPWGRCELAAEAGFLIVRIESADEEGLQRIQDIVTNDFARFSSRDPLTVRWQRDEPSGEPLPRRDSSRDADGRVPPATASAHRGRGPRWAGGNITTAALVLAVALLLAAHLGLAGTITAHSRWTGLATDAVAVLVVLKVAAIVVVRQRIRRSRNVG
jgi:hypothetical protein